MKNRSIICTIIAKTVNGGSAYIKETNYQMHTELIHSLDSSNTKY